VKVRISDIADSAENFRKMLCRIDGDGSARLRLQRRRRLVENPGAQQKAPHDAGPWRYVRQPGQAMMLTRVPWPGGSAACGGGVSLRESSCGVGSGGLAWTGCGGGVGGDALTLEILIENYPFLDLAVRVCAAACKRVMNPPRQSVPNPAKLVSRLPVPARDR
jgi:hypothetical protein